MRDGVNSSQGGISGNGQTGWIPEILRKIEAMGFSDRFNVPRERVVRNDFFLIRSTQIMELPSIVMEISEEGASSEEWLEWSHTFCLDM